MGFGWSFYGFFGLAALWLVCYFAWALWVAAREPQRPSDAHRR